MNPPKVHGRFRDRWRTYTVTSASTPDTIRVFAGDPAGRDEVCTISNLSARPCPSWSAKWNVNFPDWKQRLCDRAIDTWRGDSPTPAPPAPGPRPLPVPVFRFCGG